ncbi:acid-sensing ion channel 4-A-like isoform X2 [Acropora muricata]|uniref:acid-sensing ion channel 4-A-like isoform X2 n=1 Tax=Acropora muricata TaxID=159855 RepID=UPI0034E41789
MNEVALSEKMPTEPTISRTTSWRNAMCHKFANDTTLHGIRYVSMNQRHIVIRFIWLLLLLISGGYFILTVYKAFDKFYSHPINTIISTHHVTKMTFPAVTICPLNLFARSKMFVTDDNPNFAKSGLNISSCAVTSPVRGKLPCGLSLACCCTPEAFRNVYNAIPNCAIKYRQDLLDIIKRSSHYLDLGNFYRYYSQDVNSLISGPICSFGWELTPCSAKDFSSSVALWGMCHTFNSGGEGKIKTIKTGGISDGLAVILDTQRHEYSLGKYSEGFKVLIHEQGEYFDEREGINIGPGQHVVVALTQKRYKNLKKPYATNCTEKKLRTFSTYTTYGCLHECWAERVITSCGCRPVGYKEHLHVPTCYSQGDISCAFHLSAGSVDEVSCECFNPCNHIKYTTEVSYSKFPDPGTAEEYVSRSYYNDTEYQSGIQISKL